MFLISSTNQIPLLKKSEKTKKREKRSARDVFREIRSPIWFRVLPSGGHLFKTNKQIYKKAAL